MDVIGGIAAGVSSIGNFILGQNNNQKISEENTKNRMFSYNMYQDQKWTQDKWRREDKFWNSYKNQRRLLEEAGYNPNALFNSASTLSASNGSASAPSGSTPSTGYPTAPRFDIDPGLINVMADAKLKESQAKNIDANTSKTESETIGQDLQNSYQRVVNSIYEKYGERDFELDMDLKDSQRALNDGQRLATHVVQMLGTDELFNIRPKEAAKLVADASSSEASARLSDALAAKTDTEREYIAKDYILRSFVAAATVADLYSQKQFRDTQNTLWQPEGILYEGAYNENLRKKFEYDSKKQFFDDTYKHWKNSVLFELEAKDLYNISVKKFMRHFERHALGGALMRAISGGLIPHDYRNPGAPVSPAINFPY